MDWSSGNGVVWLRGWGREYKRGSFAVLFFVFALCGWAVRRSTAKGTTQMISVLDHHASNVSKHES